MIFVNVVY